MDLKEIYVVLCCMCTGSGFYSVAGFGISCAETLGSATSYGDPIKISSVLHITRKLKSFSI